MSSSRPDIRLRRHWAVMRGRGWAVKEEIADRRGRAGNSRTAAPKACILIMIHHPRALAARSRKDPSGNGCSAGPPLRESGGAQPYACTEIRARCLK